MIIEISYLIYLLISVSMTIWVARTLSRNGRVFLGAMHFFNMYVIARWGHKAGEWRGVQRKQADAL